MKEPKTKILVVDDEAVFVLYLKTTLTSDTCVVETACSKKEAVLKAESFKPDLIIMDINMEYTKAGIDAAREIRKFAIMPIVFTTANPEYITEEISRELSPCGIIPKPINPKILKPIVQLVLTKKYNRSF